MTRTFTYLLSIFLGGILLLSACGRGASHRQPSPLQATQSSVAMQDVLAQVDGYQAPSGVDAGVFQQLKDELVRQLRLRAGDKAVLAAPSNIGCQVRDLSYDSPTGMLTWTYANAGDYNLDGIVGVADITPLAAHFGASTTDGVGDDALEAWLDGNHNGVIDIGDITPLAMGFGSEVSIYSIESSDTLTDAFSPVAVIDFGSRDGSTIPPTFSYSDVGLPADGDYCKVQPQDSQSSIGIDSLVLNLVTGSAIITNGVIGPAGGVLNGGDVTVEVAAGGFSADTPVGITTGPADKYEDQAADGYYIDGIPDTFNQPITIRVKMNEPPGPDGVPVLALEEGDVMVYGTDAAPGREARYFQGTVESGWFIAVIPPTANDLGTSSLRSASEALDHRIYVTVVNRRHYMMSNGGKFLVYFPAGNEQLAGTVCDALDDAYTKIEGVGLSWARRTTWPLEAVIRIMGADSFDGEMVTSRFWGVNGATININATNMTTDDLAKATAGHELMHVAQYLYDKRNRVSSSWSGGGWVWMDDACATWFEKKMVTTPSYVPSTVNNNIAFVQDALATDSSEHGYGASMFITYMAKKQGDTIVGDITKKKWDSTAPIDAVKGLSSSPIAVDWQLFCQNYMKLAVYGAGTSPSSTQVMSLYTGGYVFGPNPDSWAVTFAWAGAPDLSAKVYRLQFVPYVLWTETDDLKLTFFGNDPDTAPMDAYYIVCTYANSTYKFVCGSSDHEYLMKNVKSVYDANGAVYVMVVNGSATSPYTGTRAEPINLKVERKEDFVARLHKCQYARIDAFSTHVTSHTDPPPNTSTQSLFLAHSFDTITWNGVSFSSAHEAGNPGEDVYLEGIVDPINKTMNCTVTYTYRDPNSYSTMDWTYTFAGLPIAPGSAADPYFMYPRVQGVEFGADCLLYLTDISFSGFSDVTEGTDYSYWCTDWTWNVGLPDPNPDYIAATFMNVPIG
jgi:hypothetical protein